MFQFSASTSNKLCIHLKVTSYKRCWVPPFGNLRINAYLQLPEAYRCWSRPSSAPSAKASTVRPYSLNLRSVRSDHLNNKAIELLKLIQRGVFSVFCITFQYPVFNEQIFLRVNLSKLNKCKLV